MRIITTFIFKLIIRIATANSNSNIYSNIMNERATLEVMKHTDARSSLECAAHCTQTNGCQRAQWRTSGCELLEETIQGELIVLSPEDKTIYMCKCIFLNI